jgi:hypothetical protein
VCDSPIDLDGAGDDSLDELEGISDAMPVDDELIDDVVYE